MPGAVVQLVYGTPTLAAISFDKLVRDDMLAPGSEPRSVVGIASRSSNSKTPQRLLLSRLPEGWGQWVTPAQLLFPKGLDIRIGHTAYDKVDQALHAGFRVFLFCCADDALAWALGNGSPSTEVKRSADILPTMQVTEAIEAGLLSEDRPCDRYLGVIFYGEPHIVKSRKRLDGKRFFDLYPADQILADESNKMPRENEKSIVINCVKSGHDVFMFRNIADILEWAAKLIRERGHSAESAIPSTE